MKIVWLGSTTGAKRAEQPFVLEVLDEDEDFADTGVDHEDWDLVVNWCTMESYSFWLPSLGHSRCSLVS